MRCKPGDLAVIIKGHPDNLGKVVEVIEHCVAAPLQTLPDGKTWKTADWVILSKTSPITCGATDGTESLCMWAITWDERLLPIRPLDDQQQITDAEIRKRADELLNESLGVPRA